MAKLQLATQQQPEQQTPAARARSLHQIVEQVHLVLAAIDDNDGEITTEIAEALEALTESLTLKAEVYKGACGELEAEAAACDEMAAPYLARAKAKRARIALLKSRLRSALELAGVERAIGPTGGAALQAGQARVELTGTDDDVPDVYCEHERRVNRKTLAAAIKAGEPLALACAKLVSGKALHWK